MNRRCRSRKAASSARAGCRELDELPQCLHARPPVDRRPAGARDRAHRHQEPQDQIQRRLRLLHRDHQGQRRQRARRLPPQADHRQRRALHHRRAEAHGGQDPRRRGAQQGARSTRSFSSCARACCEHLAHIQETAEAIAVLDVLARSPRPRGSSITAAPCSTRRAASSSATAATRARPSSPARTWPARAPTSARSRCSRSWRRSAASCPPPAPRSAWSTASSPASAPATTSRAASPPSWSR
jgi:hypothetical protein